MRRLDRRRHLADHCPGLPVTCASGNLRRRARRPGAAARARPLPGLREPGSAARLQHHVPPSPGQAAGPSLAGMSDDPGLRHRRGAACADLPGPACPDCGAPLKPSGRTRERTVRDRGGAQVAARPDRGRCTGCDATHVILDAGLLPGRAYAAGLIGRALASAANGHGHGHRRIARESGIPDGTVRGWIRRARRSAGQLRTATG